MLISDEFKYLDKKQLTLHLESGKQMALDSKKLISRTKFNKKVMADAAELGNIPELLAYLYKLANYLIFHYDDDVKLHFHDLGFDQLKLQQWFMNASEILQVIDQINASSEVYIEYMRSFIIIEQYLISKIFVELMHALKYQKIKNYDGRRNLTIVSKGIQLFIERNATGLKESDQIKWWEKPMYTIFREVNSDNKSKFYNKFVLDFCEGKTEKYFISALLTNYSHKIDPKLSDRGFCLKLFPIVALLCKDDRIMDVDQFDAAEDFIYGPKYYQYQIGIVKRTRKKYKF